MLEYNGNLSKCPFASRNCGLTCLMFKTLSRQNPGNGKLFMHSVACIPYLTSSHSPCQNALSLCFMKFDNIYPEAKQRLRLRLNGGWQAQHYPGLLQSVQSKSKDPAAVMGCGKMGSRCIAGGSSSSGGLAEGGLPSSCPRQPHTQRCAEYSGHSFLAFPTAGMLRKIDGLSALGSSSCSTIFK